jgi:hypothetical protein
MHSESHLTKFIDDVCSFMHSTRRRSVECVVASCLRGQTLQVTSLGRGVKRRAFEKHRIKQADRLLSNTVLHEELEEVYCAMARIIVSGVARPIVVLDWSNLDGNERHFLLRASVPTKGRSVTLYEEVHTRGTKEKLATHTRFLRKLSKILQGTKPILVTDAGFRVTWFKLVEKLGWDWVGRVRGRMKVKLDVQLPWVPGRSLHAQATSLAKQYCNAQVAHHNRLECRLVLFKAAEKNRVLRNKLGRVSARHRAQRAQSANREPLLLATSLSEKEYNTSQVIALYAARMQIEESFRDMKSENYGLGLKSSRTYKTSRMAVLVMLAALANLFAWILGKAAENTQIHRHFQANSLLHKSVLSYVFIGIRLFAQRRLYNSWNDFILARKQIPILVIKLSVT